MPWATRTDQKGRSGFRDALLEMHCSRCEMHCSRCEMHCLRCAARDALLEMHCSRCTARDALLEMRCSRCDARDAMLEMRYSRCDARDAMLEMRCTRCTARDAMLAARHRLLECGRLELVADRREIQLIILLVGDLARREQKLNTRAEVVVPCAKHAHGSHQISGESTASVVSGERVWSQVREYGLR
jgi:hypothetical protein